MAAHPGQIGLPGLVTLIYRADWTRLGLSATVLARQDAVTRGRLLLAPGGRYRAEFTGEDGPGLTVCDGESQWNISGGVAGRQDAGEPPSPLDDLLTPSWLLTDFDLDLTGTSVVGGRAAHQVVCTPRRAPAGHRACDRAFALVDAELGILLRFQAVLGRQQSRLTELTDVVLDPPGAAGPGQFRPPAGMPVRDAPPFWDRDYAISGMAGRVARLVAGPAAAAVGFVARHAPVGPASDAAQTDEVIPAPRRAAARAAAEPISDDLVSLLYQARSRPLTFTADVHTWTDEAARVRLVAASRASLPAAINGIIGPDQLWNAFADRVRGTTHRITRLTVAMPGRYRIDHLAGGRPDRPATIACDGERLWKVYPNRVATGPVSERDLPGPLKAAKIAAGLGAAGAAALTGWLQKHPPGPPAPPGQAPPGDR